MDTKQLLPVKQGPEYKAVFSAIGDGSILECSAGELEKHAMALCVYHIDAKAQDQTAAAMFLNHLLLSRLVDRVNTRNRIITWAVIFLTFVSAVTGSIQAVTSVMGLKESRLDRASRLLEQKGGAPTKGTPTR